MLRSVTMKKFTVAPIFALFAVIMICGKRKSAIRCMQTLPSKKKSKEEVIGFKAILLRIEPEYKKILIRKLLWK